LTGNFEQCTTAEVCAYSHVEGYYGRRIDVEDNLALDAAEVALEAYRAGAVDCRHAIGVIGIGMEGEAGHIGHAGTHIDEAGDGSGYLKG